MTVSTHRESTLSVLLDDVTGRITHLQDGYLGRRGPAAQANAQADLARLRGADPADPIASADAWPIVQDNSPQALTRGAGDEPTIAECARHCAMVMYARHQQSQDQPMHRRGTSFPQAVRLLGSRRASAGEEFDPNVRQRFDQVLLSPTWAGRCEHLNALIRLLRTEGIGFDYEQLCRGLFQLSYPDGARAVRTRWARDLYRKPNAENDTPGTEPDQPTIEGDLS